jgi:hypothetical protein
MPQRRSIDVWLDIAAAALTVYATCDREQLHRAVLLGVSTLCKGVAERAGRAGMAAELKYRERVSV